MKWTSLQSGHLVKWLLSHNERYLLEAAFCKGFPERTHLALAGTGLSNVRSEFEVDSQLAFWRDSRKREVPYARVGMLLGLDG